MTAFHGQIPDEHAGALGVTWLILVKGAMRGRGYSADSL